MSLILENVQVGQDRLLVVFISHVSGSNDSNQQHPLPSEEKKEIMRF